MLLRESSHLIVSLLTNHLLLRAAAEMPKESEPAKQVVVCTQAEPPTQVYSLELMEWFISGHLLPSSSLLYVNAKQHPSLSH